MNQTRTDGSVVSWGSPFCGGDSTLVRAELQGVLSVAATHRAFAALRASVGGIFLTKNGEKERYPDTPRTPGHSKNHGTPGHKLIFFCFFFKGVFFLGVL